jgi:hypothetical protein
MSKRSSSRSANRRAQPRPPLLAAALIVRDEALCIENCLQSLDGVVEAVRVHDTGSTDATPELARAAGARVSQGPWTSDFAAARNAALEGLSAKWVLSIDADEQAVADTDALRKFLKTTNADVLVVPIENRSQDGTSVTHQTARLFRPDRARWFGRIHEMLVARHGGELRYTPLPPGLLHIVHLGYSTAEVVQAKGLRNLEMARAHLGDLAKLGDDVPPELAAPAVFDLGRSLYGAHQFQEAIEAFETVRELFPDTNEWRRATDLLTGLLIGQDVYDVALTLIVQLRGAGVDPMYCNWLEAHCLARLGHFEMARGLLEDITEVVDTSGVRRNPSELNDLKAELDRRLEARGATPVA